MNNLVSQDELLEAFGFSRPADLRRCMDKQNIVYYLDDCGRVFTTIQDINRRLIGDANVYGETEILPWRLTCQTPHDWFMENADRFVIPIETFNEAACELNWDDIPNEAGIYFLYWKGDLVYIGETTSFINRLLQHHETKLFDGYSIFTGIPSLYRKDIETYYIHKYQPQLNIKYDHLHEAFKGMVSA